MTAPSPRVARLPLLVSRVLAVGSLACLAVLAACHAFNKDEVENVHSAWLVASGLRPYTDFFQHHQPLMWNGLALLLPWTGQSASTMLAVRALMFAQLAAIAVITYHLAAPAALEGRDGPEGPLVPWVAFALLVSMGDFVRNAYLARPEVPATLCAVAAALLLAHSGDRPWKAAASGLLLGLAALFSLKAVPFLAMDALALALWWRRRTVSGRFIVVLAAACVVPVALFALRLAATGTLRDYYLATWVVNAAITSEVLDTRFVPGSLPWLNAPFWILGSLAAVWLLVRRDRRAPLEISALNGLGLVIVLFATGRTESRSMWSAVPFLAVTAAAGFDHLRRSTRLSPAVAAAALVAICAAALGDMARQLPETNRDQLDLMAFVLAQTPEGETVYDGRNQFNLFRRDPDYFWFYPRLGLSDPPARAEAIRASMAALLGRNPGSGCDLVRTVRPRIVSTQTIDLDACGLAADYVETPYPTIRARK